MDAVAKQQAEASGTAQAKGGCGMPVGAADRDESRGKVACMLGLKPATNATVPLGPAHAGQGNQAKGSRWQGISAAGR